MTAMEAPATAPALAIDLKDVPTLFAVAVVVFFMPPISLLMPVMVDFRFLSFAPKVTVASLMMLILLFLRVPSQF